MRSQPLLDPLISISQACYKEPSSIHYSSDFFFLRSTCVTSQETLTENARHMTIIIIIIIAIAWYGAAQIAPVSTTQHVRGLTPTRRCDDRSFVVFLLFLRALVLYYYLFLSLYKCFHNSWTCSVFHYYRRRRGTARVVPAHRPHFKRSRPQRRPKRDHQGTRKPKKKKKRRSKH